MKAAKVFCGLIGLFIQLPLMFYMGWLLYRHVGATDLMWFLWWVSMPLIILVNVITKLAEATQD